MIKHCCKDMEEKVLVLRDGQADTDENKVIDYLPIFREYGIPVRDDSSSGIRINYCPWCGKPLPNSKRVEWFETLEKMGYDSPFEQDIPEEFKSEKWYEDQE